MNVRPETSVIVGPLALRMNSGVPPTPRKARTGELTPPGISSSARSNSRAEVSWSRSGVDMVEAYQLENEFTRSTRLLARRTALLVQDTWPALHWDRGRPARKTLNAPAVRACGSTSSLGPRASRPHGAPQARTSFSFLLKLLEPGTTKPPITRLLTQTTLYRIVFNVLNCPAKVFVVPNVPIEIIWQPELSAAVEYPVGFVGGVRLKRVENGL